MRAVHHLLFLMLSGTVAEAASAQHVHSAERTGTAVQATTTLSSEQVRELLAGEGMGLAKPAELQRYPGPKHLLDRATELGLTGDQQRQLTAIRDRMLAEARGLGSAIVDAERRLDAAFASKTITSEALTEQTAAIATLYGRLRAVHLNAHVAARPLLTSAQVEKYYAGM